MKQMQLFKILITVLALESAITGCSSSHTKAPVSDRNSPPSERIHYHIVARGETLYSIAWRYNLNYRQLAKANGVDSSYNIYPGQRIYLDLSDAPAERSQTANTLVHKAPGTSSVKKVPPTPAKQSRSKNKSPIASHSTQKNDRSAAVSWRWPATGKLLATFSSNNGLNKGIDIKGELGDSVNAASAGQVVYAGSGLRGYGKLIIVKHSDKYLSAYAHSRKILVKEGDKVKIGEKIAEMGSTGTDTVKLHFEIRYDGKPVDPLKILPRN